MKRKQNNNYDNAIYSRIECSGYGVVNVVSNFIKNNIEIFNIEKNVNEISFYVYTKDLNKIAKINIDNCDINIVKSSKNNRLKQLISGILCIVIVISIVCLCQNRLFYIKIYGVENIDKNEIISSISMCGVKKFSIMNYDLHSVEKYIYDNYNVSMVSAINKGSCLIINIKEEIPNSKMNYNPIVSPCNLIVDSIDIYSGTLCVEPNSIVYTNDVLVEPWVMIDGEKVYVEPSAKICGKTYLTESFVFDNLSYHNIRTGKYQCVSCEMFLGKISLFNSSKDVSFDNYEIMVNCTNTSLMLPIRCVKTIAYELNTIEVVNDFNSKKDIIIETLKNNCMSRLIPCMSVYDQYSDINSYESGYILNYTICCEVLINY